MSAAAAAAARGCRGQERRLVAEPRPERVARAGRWTRGRRSRPRSPARRGPGRAARRDPRTRSRAGSDLHGAGSAQREPGLAAAAGAGQRDDAVAASASRTRDLRLAADEGRHVARQVRRGVERPQPPPVVGDAGNDEPVEPGRLLEVLDRAETLVDELDAGETRRLGQGGPIAAPGRPRARSGRRSRPRRSGPVVHGDADVVLRLADPEARAQPPLAEVEPHPDPEDVERPGRRRDPALTVDRGPCGVERVREGGEGRHRPRS